jgi:hypothetical protein
VTAATHAHGFPRAHNLAMVMNFVEEMLENPQAFVLKKQMGLENIALSEVSQVQKDKGLLFLSYVENRSKYSIITCRYCIYICISTHTEPFQKWDC